MNIIVINPILFTPEKEVVPFVQTIKETMIYDLCMAYLRLGHSVTLLAAADFKPAKEEAYDFEVDLETGFQTRIIAFYARGVELFAQAAPRGRYGTDERDVLNPVVSVSSYRTL